MLNSTEHEVKIAHNSLNFISFLYNKMCTYNTISSYTDHFEEQKGIQKKVY